MQEDVTARLYDILRRRNPAADLHADLPLGSGGLELDSVGIVDLLLECEDAFRVSLAADMLDGSSLTAGALAAKIQALRS